MLGAALVFCDEKRGQGSKAGGRLSPNLMARRFVTITEIMRIHVCPKATARPAPLLVWVKSLPLQVKIAEGHCLFLLTA